MAEQSRLSESQLPIFTDHLIFDEILPRLPVKSLIRFKSVSKHWFSIISSQEFAKIRLKSFSNCNQGFILWKPPANDKFLSFDECLNVKEYVRLDSKYPSLNLVPKFAKVVGSCNGLVCLCDPHKRFHLWNPATNQCRNAHCPDDVNPPSYGRTRINQCSNAHCPDDVPPPSHSRTRIMGDIDGRKRFTICNRYLGYGFGYVRSIDDYRIACLWICLEGLCHVYVYSFKARTWEEVASFDENFYVELGGFIGNAMGGNIGLVIGDSMYWPPVISNEHDSHMVVLDLVRGELKKIPLMGFGVSYASIVKVFLMKGCLSLYCMNHINGCRDLHVSDVWRLKQLDDWNSWEKVISFENINGELPFHLFEAGECLVRKGRNQLILHRPSQAAPEKYGEGNLIWQDSEDDRFCRSVDGAWGYVESLISPFGTPEMMPRLENE